MAGLPEININVQHSSLSVGHLRMLCGLPKEHGKSRSDLQEMARKRLNSLPAGEYKLSTDVNDHGVLKDGVPVLKAVEFKSIVALLGIEQPKPTHSEAFAKAMSEERSESKPAGAGAMTAFNPANPMAAFQQQLQKNMMAMMGASATDSDDDAPAAMVPAGPNPMAKMMETQMAVMQAMPEPEKVVEGVKQVFAAGEMAIEAGRVGTEITGRVLEATGADSAAAAAETMIEGATRVAGAASTAAAFVEGAGLRVDQARETVASYAKPLKVAASVAMGVGVTVGVGLTKAAFETALESLGAPMFATMTLVTGAATWFALSQAQSSTDTAAAPESK